jgi:hypothetical protein
LAQQHDFPPRITLSNALNVKLGLVSIPSAAVAVVDAVTNYVISKSDTVTAASQHLPADSTAAGKATTVPSLFGCDEAYDADSINSEGEDIENSDPGAVAHVVPHQPAVAVKSKAGPISQTDGTLLSRMPHFRINGVVINSANRRGEMVTTSSSKSRSGRGRYVAACAADNDMELGAALAPALLSGSKTAADHFGDVLEFEAFKAELHSGVSKRKLHCPPTTNSVYARAFEEIARCESGESLRSVQSLVYGPDIIKRRPNFAKVALRPPAAFGSSSSPHPPMLTSLVPTTSAAAQMRQRRSATAISNINGGGLHAGSNRPVDVVLADRTKIFELTDLIALARKPDSKVFEHDVLAAFSAIVNARSDQLSNAHNRLDAALSLSNDAGGVDGLLPNRATVALQLYKALCLFMSVTPCAATVAKAEKAIAWGHKSHTRRQKSGSKRAPDDILATEIDRTSRSIPLGAAPIKSFTSMAFDYPGVYNRVAHGVAVGIGEIDIETVLESTAARKAANARVTESWNTPLRLRWNKVPIQIIASSDAEQALAETALVDAKSKFGFDFSDVTSVWVAPLTEKRRKSIVTNGSVLGNLTVFLSKTVAKDSSLPVIAIGHGQSMLMTAIPNQSGIDKAKRLEAFFNELASVVDLNQLSPPDTKHDAAPPHSSTQPPLASDDDDNDGGQPLESLDNIEESDQD